MKIRIRQEKTEIERQEGNPIGNAWRLGLTYSNIIKTIKED